MFAVSALTLHQIADLVVVVNASIVNLVCGAAHGRDFLRARASQQVVDEAVQVHRHLVQVASHRGAFTDQP